MKCLRTLPRLLCFAAHESAELLYRQCAENVSCVLYRTKRLTICLGSIRNKYVGIRDTHHDDHHHAQTAGITYHTVQVTPQNLIIPKYIYHDTHTALTSITCTPLPYSVVCVFALTIHLEDDIRGVCPSKR